MIFFPFKNKKPVHIDNDINNKINTIRYLNRPFILKEKYEPIIPLNLFTCWHTKNLPPLMRENYEKIKETHPNFCHYLYDEIDCENFIKENFNSDVLNAYKSLIPSSYKSDLWRYCILYINGGIYFDIKFSCVNNFNFIALTENQYFVRDREPWGGTLTGLIAVKPKNEILLKCIQQIVINVKTKFYGRDSLDPTGPGLLGKYFTKEEKKEMKLYFANINIKNIIDDWIIVFNDISILKQYNGYRSEQTKKHYGDLWRNKQIYL